MRICSLVSGATEVVAALDLTDQLVAVSHECDYPESIRHVPSVVESVIDQHTLSSDAIDRTVKQLVSTGQRLYRLNEQRLIEARPDVILTQDLCHVCAVTPDQLTQAIKSLISTSRLVDGVELLAAIFHPRPSHHLNPAQAVRLSASMLSVESRS